MSNTGQIQRYEQHGSRLIFNDNGDWVLFEDHEKIANSLRFNLVDKIDRIEDLKAVITEIKRTLSHSPTDELIRSLIKTTEV